MFKLSMLVLQPSDLSSILCIYDKPERETYMLRVCNDVPIVMGVNCNALCMRGSSIVDIIQVGQFFTDVRMLEKEKERF